MILGSNGICWTCNSWATRKIEIAKIAGYEKMTSSMLVAAGSPS